MLGGAPPQTFTPDMRFDQLSAEQMNQLSRAARMVLNLEVGRGLQKIMNGDRLIINRVDERQGVSLPGSGVFQMVVKTFDQGAEYVVCNRIVNDTQGSTDIEVALPYSLRAHKTRGGVDYTYPTDYDYPGERTAKDPVTLRQQREVIGEPYLPGDELWAWNVRVSIDHTPEPTIEDPYPSPVTKTYDWLDANNDARRWLALPIEGSISEVLAQP